MARIPNVFLAGVMNGFSLHIEPPSYVKPAFSPNRVLRRMITIPLISLQLILIVTLCVATPLDDYVNKPDPAYSYSIIGKIPEPSYTVYIVNMTSQTWKPSKYYFKSIGWIAFA